MPLSERHGDRVRADSPVDVRRRGDAAGFRANLQKVAGLDSKGFSGLGVDLHPGVPYGLGHRVREFLHPGPVGAPPVVELDGRIGDEREIVRRTRGLECVVGGRGGQGWCHVSALGHGQADSAVRKRLVPPVFERRCPGAETGVQLAPHVLEVAPVVRDLERVRRSGRGRDLQEDVLPLTRVEHGLHHGLGERHVAPAEQAIPPRLQLVVGGEDPAGRCRGLVRVRRQRYHVRNVCQRLCEPGRRGHGVRRIGPGDDQRLDLAGVHATGELDHGGERHVARTQSLAVERHRSADRARHVVEEHDCQMSVRCRGPLRGDSRGKGDGGSSLGELVCQVLQLVGRDVRRLGYGLDRKRREHRFDACRATARLPRRDLACHGESDECLGAGPRRNPLVGLEAGEGEAGADECETGLRSVVGEPAGREAGGQLNGREPRAEEVRAEADDVVRRVDPVCRNRVESERDLVRGTQCFQAERFPWHPCRADRARPLLVEVGR